MQDYINEQPGLLARTVDHRMDLVGDFVNSCQDEDIERIVLIGSGSSYNAALMAKPFIEKVMGIEVDVIYPSRLQDITNIAAQKVLYIVVSQGGHSSNTSQAIKELRNHQLPLVGVTEFPNSPIGEQVDLALIIPIGEELIGAKTKGVTTSTLMLMLAFLELGARQKKINNTFYLSLLEAFSKVFGHMTDNIQRAIDWCGSVIPIFSPLDTLTIIAKGNEIGAASEGRLKLLETICRPVIYYEFEEYLHGPQNTLDSDTYTILLLPEDDDEERMLRLSEFANRQGAHFVLIDRLDKQQQNERLSLTSAGNTLLTCFEFLPPLQTLSAQFSKQLGVDITRPKYPDFSSAMGTKLG